MTIYNFNPGPAALPVCVQEKAAAAVVDWSGTGVSILAHSHRSPLLADTLRQTQLRVRQLLQVPDEYSILFMTGGASSQFALVPQNFAVSAPGGYAVTGSWGVKALAEAQRLQSGIRVTPATERFTAVPPLGDWNIETGEFAYLHLTSNETIDGVQFADFPDTQIPLVADMSSDLFSRQFTVSQFALIYAGAQKNFGPAGVTLVIVRNDFLASARAGLPKAHCYQTYARTDSVFNTPPVFAWYVADLTLEWVQQQGGVAALEAENRRKSELLYRTLDSSDFYLTRVRREARSMMNVPFNLPTPALEQRFLGAVEEQGFIGLKGHRSVGGIRASLYNAVGIDAVTALVEFMQEFERSHG